MRFCEIHATRAPCLLNEMGEEKEEKKGVGSRNGRKMTFAPEVNFSACVRVLCKCEHGMCYSPCATRCSHNGFTTVKQSAVFIIVPQRKTISYCLKDDCWRWRRRRQQRRRSKWWWFNVAAPKTHNNIYAPLLGTIIRQSFQTYSKIYLSKNDKHITDKEKFSSLVSLGAVIGGHRCWNIEKKM